jgi:hypothetical protein
VTIAAEVNEDRSRRLVNQSQFPHLYVKCLCERGCYVCAYTGLVSKAQVKHASAT